jgi:hypothetical protein
LARHILRAAPGRDGFRSVRVAISAILFAAAANDHECCEVSGTIPHARRAELAATAEWLAPNFLPQCRVIARRSGVLRTQA